MGMKSLVVVTAMIYSLEKQKLLEKKKYETLEPIFCKPLVSVAWVNPQEWAFSSNNAECYLAVNFSKPFYIILVEQYLKCMGQRGWSLGRSMLALISSLLDGRALKKNGSCDANDAIAYILTRA